MDELEHMVLKRQSTLDYLKRCHMGSTHWLNIIKLSRADIVQHHDPRTLELRSEQWFLLGLSCGRILELPAGHLAVRACAQLFEEYDYFISHGMV
jgi:hypothetical protein